MLCCCKLSSDWLVFDQFALKDRSLMIVMGRRSHEHVVPVSRKQGEVFLLPCPSARFPRCRIGRRWVAKGGAISHWVESRVWHKCLSRPVRPGWLSAQGGGGSPGGGG